MASRSNRIAEASPMPPKRFTDTFAEYSKEDTTVILNASQTPYKLDSTFQTITNTCLIYSERIELEKVPSMPGKSLGLFCTELIVPEKAVVDVSGKGGRPGANSATDNGEAGKNGCDAGRVWLFVQEATTSMMKNLQIKAFGGDGGKGGDCSTRKPDDKDDKKPDDKGDKNLDEKDAEMKIGVVDKKKRKKKTAYIGGDGGAGGNGGNIEVVIGTPINQVAMKVASLKKKPWPQQALSLLNGIDLHSPEQFSDRLSADDRIIVGKYLKYQESLASVLGSLNDLSGSSDPIHPLREAIHTHLQDIKSPKADILAASTGYFTEVALKLQNLNPIDDNSETIKKFTIAEHLAKTTDESELFLIVDDLSFQLVGEVRDFEKEVWGRCHLRGGEGGQGGRSPTALDKPGKRGPSGTNGVSRVVHMNPKGSMKELEASQAFAFPDQCQMLLQQADLAFYNTAPEQLEWAATLYQRIINRLGFLRHAEFDEENPKPLMQAYNRLSAEKNMTLFPETTLRSIRDQSEKRLNRLYLGRDMWGHTPSWVPRMSVKYYDAEVDRSLSLLKDEEKLISEYEDAIQKGNDLKRYVSTAVSALEKSRDAAEAKIKQLTADNGPLNTAVYKIVSFTPQLKAKKYKIKEQISKLKDQFTNPPFDPMLVLDALSTLMDCSIDMKSVLKVLKKSIESFESTKDYEDKKYGVTKREYIIDEIKTFEGDIDELQDSFTTRKDHTIDVADPNSVKILASSAKINDLFKKYANVFPEVSRKELKEILKDYQKTVKTRNDAVVEYNSCIQLLFENSGLLDSLEKQAQILGHKAISIDANLPSVVHWLRKSRDDLRLSIMQDLNNQRRAIRFWGLDENPSYTEAMPLQNEVTLKKERGEIHKTFRECLEQRYATNVRSIWPRDDKQQGIFYKLSDEERSQLTMGKATLGSRSKVYSTLVRIDSQTSRNIFRNNVDIRLRQIRLWLFGADCDADVSGRKRLTIALVHMGDETIQTESRQEIVFSHDSVQISFDYYVDRVSKIEEAVSEHVFGKQHIEDSHYINDGSKDSNIAAIGPLATWKLYVSEEDNPGLKMNGVKDAVLEFRGTSLSASV